VQWDPAQLLFLLHFSSLPPSHPKVLPPIQTIFTRRKSGHCLGTFIAVNLTLFSPIMCSVSHYPPNFSSFSLSLSFWLQRDKHEVGRTADSTYHSSHQIHSLKENMLVRQSNSPLFSLMSFITLMMETVRTSETSVYSNESIRLYITEDSHLQGLSSKKLTN
jgi:hypothetical protein